MKCISLWARAQGLRVRDPESFNGSRAIGNHDGDVSHLDLENIAICFGPVAVLKRGIDFYIAKVSYDWPSSRTLQPGDSSSVADDFIGEDIDNEESQHM